MSARRLSSPLPPTFSKSPQRDVSSRSGVERNLVSSSSPSGASELSTNVDSKHSTSASVGAEKNSIMSWESTTWVWIIVVPIAVWCLLLILLPTFVKKSSDGSKLDQSSMLLWTLIISLVIWILFFGFAKCKTC